MIRVELPSQEEQELAAVPERPIRSALAWVVGAIVVVAMGWLGYRLSSSGKAPQVVPLLDAPALQRVDVTRANRLPFRVIAHVLGVLLEREANAAHERSEPLTRVATPIGLEAARQLLAEEVP